MLCLIIFCLDLAVKSYLIGWEEFRKSKWLISYTVVICISVVDWMLSVSMECDEKLRVRRLVRPFFLLQNSSLMKKTLKCIKRTLPEIARCYAIFFIIFSIIGTYCLMNLLTAIIYNQFRGYLLMSVQTSIIRRRLGIRAAFHVLSCHNSQTEAQELVRVDAVLQVMSRVNMKRFYKSAITFAEQGYMDRQQFRKIFDELDKDCIKEHPPLPQYTSATLQKLQVVFSHYYLTVLGNLVALANVLCICTILVLNSEKSTEERDNYILEVINLCFILFYLSEMTVKIFAFGWRGYLSYRSNIFDGFLTVLVIMFLYMVRLVNMLIVFRFLRIIPDIKLMALVASTLLDLVKNLRAFAGILVVVYYVFAVFGIWLFEGAIKPPPQMSVFSMDNTTSNFSTVCGTYEQLGYWPNNFDDFAVTIILLYDVMIVNNWQAFMEAYSRYTSEWSKVYFVCWWLTSSVMWVNLFVALILENFIYKWDRSHSCSVTDVEKIRYETSVQFMFKEQIQEPTEEELVCQLHQHPHLHLEWRHEHQNITSSLH
uniref:Two pore segment channel 2 n=1 Tax=Poecilia latipinna TaxID=48699 RepID=A0A3B3TNN6_9TELE